MDFAMSVTRHIILTAGGTGGHMMPAYALGAELIARGHRVALVTDERGAKIPGHHPDIQMHTIPAGRITRSPGSWPAGFGAIRRGRAMVLDLIREFEPAAVVGFGGYPSFPTLLAARSARVPTLIHEQNAVLGRVNRFFARMVDAIATAYPDVARVPASAEARVHLVGNPVREEVIALRTQGFPPLDEQGIFRLLVTGGSQGASIFADVVPDALAMMPLNFRQRLQVTQQCRPEDLERVRAAYAANGIPAELSTYIEDFPAKLGWSHLVIGRAGASTIAELTVAGRPAILVPLPIATDDHQTFNAREMVSVGGARAIPQTQFTPVELAKQMQKLAMEPGGLQNAAARARACGRPDAVRDMCDLIESFGPAPQTVDTVRVEEPALPGLAGAAA